MHFFRSALQMIKIKKNNLFSHRYLGLVRTLLAKAEIPSHPWKKNQEEDGLAA